MVMYTKLLLTIRTLLFELETNNLIDKILDDNILISTLAKEELFKRDLTNLFIPSQKLELLINKFTLEEIWLLAKTDVPTEFKNLIFLKLNQILDYYQNKNISEFLQKKMETDNIIHLVK